MAAGGQTLEELQTNVHSYAEQQQQVEQLLLMDPENQELLDMYNDLQEVMTLTQDLLREAAAAAAAGDSAGASTSASGAAGAAAAQAAAGPGSLAAAQHDQETGVSSTAGAAGTQPPDSGLPLMLPASVAEQIRRAQVKAALSGQGPGAWAIGATCLALYSADGQHYPAVVESVTEQGNFVVVFEGYGNKEEVAPSGVRPPADPAEGEEGYSGVAAPRRKRVEERPVVTEIPKWLEIKPTDDEKSVARKKKLLKSFKSKLRFTNLDMAQKQKQDTWQSFLKGKGTKKKTGFMTGRKKESIFKVPQGVGSKVGVIGSGQGMTDYQKVHRHEFNLDE